MAEEQATPEPIPSKKSPLKLIILLTIAVALGGGGAFAAMKLMSSPPAEDVTEVPEQENAVANSDPSKLPDVGHLTEAMEFRVNLNEDAGSYLILEVSLGLVDDNAVIQAFEERKPLIRDRLVLLLSDLTLEEINSIDGKQALKQEIILRLEPIIGIRNIRGVYFQEFMLQLN